MSQDQVLPIRLRRTTTSTPWGFRMQGGNEYGTILFIQKVNPKSISYRLGLRLNDRIVAIGNVQTHGMSHEQAKMEIIRAGNELDLLVQRTPGQDQTDYNRPVQRVPQPQNQLSEESTEYRGYTNPNVQSRSFKILQESLNYSESGEEGMVLPSGNIPGEGIVLRAYNEGRRRMEELMEINPRNFTTDGESPYRFNMPREQNETNASVAEPIASAKQYEGVQSAPRPRPVPAQKPVQVQHNAPVQVNTPVNIAASSVLSPAGTQQQYLQQAHQHYQNQQPDKPVQLTNYQIGQQYGNLHQNVQQQSSPQVSQQASDFIPATKTVSSVAEDLDLRIVKTEGVTVSTDSASVSKVQQSTVQQQQQTNVKQQQIVVKQQQQTVVQQPQQQQIAIDQQPAQTPVEGVPIRRRRQRQRRPESQEVAQTEAAQPQLAKEQPQPVQEQSKTEQEQPQQVQPVEPNTSKQSQEPTATPTPAPEPTPKSATDAGKDVTDGVCVSKQADITSDQATKTSEPEDVKEPEPKQESTQIRDDKSEKKEETTEAAQISEKASEVHVVKEEAVQKCEESQKVEPKQEEPKQKNEQNPIETQSSEKAQSTSEPAKNEQEKEPEQKVVEQQTEKKQDDVAQVNQTPVDELSKTQTESEKPAVPKEASEAADTKASQESKQEQVPNTVETNVVIEASTTENVTEAVTEAVTETAAVDKTKTEVQQSDITQTETIAVSTTEGSDVNISIATETESSSTVTVSEDAEISFDLSSDANAESSFEVSVSEGTDVQADVGESITLSVSEDVTISANSDVVIENIEVNADNTAEISIDSSAEVSFSMDIEEPVAETSKPTETKVNDKRPEGKEDTKAPQSGRKVGKLNLEERKPQNKSASQKPKVFGSSGGVGERLAKLQKK